MSQQVYSLTVSPRIGNVISGAEVFATVAALVSTSRSGGAIAFATDIQQHFVRQDDTWARLALWMPQATTEPLTLRVSPSSGAPALDGVTWSSQAQIDAHGAFDSFATAVAVLPDKIRHVVTLLHDDGDYTVDGLTYFGDWSRFEFGEAARFVLRSESIYERVPGTNIMLVASAAARTLTVDSDPGFDVDEHKGAFVRIESGKGFEPASAVANPLTYLGLDTGQPHAIVSHTGSTFTLIGNWWDGASTPDATSAVEIVRPALRLTFSYAQQVLKNIAILNRRSRRDSVVLFHGIDFVGAGLYVTNGIVLFAVSRFLGGGFLYLKGAVGLGHSLTMAGTGAQYSYAILGLGGGLRTPDSSCSVLIDNYESGLRYSSDSGGNFLFSTAIINCVNGINLTGASNVGMASAMVGSGNTYGIVATQGSRLALPAGFPAGVTGPTGGTADVLVDGTPYSYAEINGESGDFVIGAQGSIVGVGVY